MRTLPLIATALLALASASAPAADHQGWQVGNDAIHLYNGDLDVNSAAGRAQLLARVERAADKLCRDRAFRGDCVAQIVRETARQRSGTSIQLALAERGPTRLAAR